VIRRGAASRGLVLVAESNAAMGEAIDGLLQIAGFPSVVYAYGEALIAAGLADDALCVISDIALADMSGFDLLGRLHERHSAPSVILISAHDLSAIRDRAQQCGAAAYLAKPFAGAALVAEIERIAGSSRPRGSKKSD
jgi:DNA-binding response OmpR family regulator